VKPDTYKLLQQCIEDGIDYGYHRAHKHIETPNEDALKQAIFNAVMLEICEWFRFDDPNTQW